MSLFQSRTRHFVFLALCFFNVASQPAYANQQEINRLFSLANQSISLANQNQWQAAEAPAAESYALARQYLGDQNENTLLILDALTKVYVNLNKLQQAEALLVGAIPAGDAALGREHSTTVSFRATLSHLYDLTGRQDRAIPLNEEVYAAYQRTKGQNAPETLMSGTNLATTFLNAGQPERAETLLSDLENRAASALAPNDPITGQIAALRAMLNVAAGNLGAALPELERRFNSAAQSYPVNSSDYLLHSINLAAAYLGNGNVQKASPLFEEAVKYAPGVFGPDHNQTLAAHEGWGLVLSKQGRYQEAEQHITYVYDRRLATLGQDDVNTLKAMSNLAQIFNESGQIAKAGPALQAVYEASTRHLGENADTTLIALINLAAFQMQIGRIAETGPVLEATVAKLSSARRPDDPIVLSLKNILGTYYYDALGDADKALELHTEVYQVRRATLQPGDTELLTSVYNLSLTLQAKGDYQRTNEFLSAVVDAVTQAGAADVVMFANVRALLANSKVNLGQLVEGAALYRQVIADMTGVMGDAHPQVLAVRQAYADGLSASGQTRDALSEMETIIGIYDRIGASGSLGALGSRYGRIGALRGLGRMSEAETAARDLLTDQKQVLGASHLNTLLTQATLAAILQANGQSEEAARINGEALALARTQMGDTHPQTQQILSVQASVLEALGDFAGAETIYRDIAAALTPQLGSEHVLVLSAEANRASTLMQQGRTQDAFDLSQKTLATARRALGEGHPLTNALVNNAGALASNLGNFAAAADLHQTAYNFRLNAYGDRHPDTILSQVNLALSKLALGDIDGSTDMLRQSLDASLGWAQLEANLADQKSGQKRALENARRAERVTYSIAALIQTEKTMELAADIAISTKARLGEREQAILQAIRNPLSPEAVLYGDQYIAARQEVQEAFERMNAVDGDAFEEASRTFTDALGKVDKAESQLARVVPALSDKQPIAEALGNVQSRLQDQDLLVEYIVYFPEEANGAQRLDTPHYAAILIRKNRSPIFVGLGPRSDVLPLIESLRRDMGNGDEGYFAALDLYTKLIEPLLPYTNSTKRLFISPVDVISMVPFDLLATDEGTTLGDRFTEMRFVTSGRAFYPQAPADPEGNLVIFGDVDYQSVTDTPRPVEESSAMAIASLRTGTDQSILRASPFRQFSPLPATIDEIAKIADVWRKSTSGNPVVYRRENASEKSLAGIKRPRVLHLATHGFVQDADDTTNARTALRTGIALAGANGRDGRTASDDGILYGYDIERLDLHGTELVVLSACETGVGTSDLNEGVYNLARAFKLAGARAVLVTLTPVDDQKAARFVAEFYDAWLGTPGESPASALAKVKSAWAAAGDDPAIWGAFVLIENQIL